MASNESLALDGLELNPLTGVYSLDELHIGIPKKRPNWISGADSDGAVLEADPHWDNRTITCTVRVTDSTRDLVHAGVAAIVDKLEECERQDDGLALVWTPANSTKSVTFDVLSGEVGDEIPVTWESGYFSNSVQVPITLTCKPLWRGVEVQVGTVTASTPVVTLTCASVAGDAPALGRLVVTDASSHDRQFVMWGMEQRFYNASTSILLDSTALTVSGFSGAATTRTGAYDPVGSGNTVLRGTLTSVPVAICGTGNLSHVGTFRVWGRVFAAAGSTYVRVSWKAGDGPWRANGWVLAMSNVWDLVDLGHVTSPTVAAGTQRLQVRVESYSTVSGLTLDVDYLAMMPTREGYGQASTPAVLTFPAVFSARDEFDQTAGALAGKALPVGGSWAATGTGDTDDFSVDGSGGLTRTALSDTSPGRLVFAGTGTAAGVGVQLDIKTDTSSQIASQGAFVRWVDGSNYVRAYGFWNGPNFQVRMDIVVAGVSIAFPSFATTGGVGLPAAVGSFATIRFVIDSGGRYFMYWGPQGGALTLVKSGQNAALSASGALATGRYGLYENQVGASASTRSFDNFQVWAIPADAACFSAQSIEFRSDTTIRKDASGTYYGQPAAYRGSRFYVPPAGGPNRTSRIAVLASRNNVADAENTPASGDSLTATAFAAPRGIALPR